MRRRLDRLEDVDKGELVRWSLGMLLVGDYSGVAAWPTWSSLFESYRRVRDEYLVQHRVRFPSREPGIETLYKAWVVDGDSGAQFEKAKLAQERLEQDPRRLLRI